MSERKVPRLRFLEFSGDWVSKLIGEIGRVSMCKRVLKDHTLPIGEIPFYKIGTFGKIADAYITKELYNKYSSEYPYPKLGDILISASGTIGRTVVYDGKPAYFQDSNIVWIDNNEKLVINKYLYHCYQKIKWVTEDTTIARLYNDNLRNISINIPKLIEEQTKIADFLTRVDDKIQQLTKKKELLEQYKKGLMRDIFSQKIRFKDENGNDYPDWEEKILGDIAKKCITKNRNEKVNLVLTNSAVSGIVSQLDYFDKDIANSNNLSGYWIVNRFDFVYNPRISVNAPVGPINCNYLATGVMSPLYTVFRFNQGIVKFFEYYYKTSLWHEYMKSIANYGARDDRMNITSSSFFEMPVICPCVDEQEKIVDFLTNLDDKIAQIATRLEKTKLFKKSLLQQMFI